MITTSAAIALAVFVTAAKVRISNDTSPTPNSP